MSIALQHSLNDILSHESDAEMSPLSDGGLESEIFAFIADNFTVEICCRTYGPPCSYDISRANGGFPK